ncbi:MAG: hypothetical protein DDT40_00278 [candidate division WS2 bacterium]|nr:hypothetical protein [Candidatus Psychracetigena formicireducens]
MKSDAGKEKIPDLKGLRFFDNYMTLGRIVPLVFSHAVGGLGIHYELMPLTGGTNGLDC